MNHAGAGAMLGSNAADFIVEALAGGGVRHVFGVGGANIEDLFAAVQRRRPQLRAVLTKHEHGAGTAADAYARLGGGLGVVMVTSGGGAMNLVHALAEARASRVPMLALVGEPPTEAQGRGAFQDTSGRAGAIDAAPVFAAVSKSCVRLKTAADLPDVLDALFQAALGGAPGPVVLLMAKDLQRAPLPLARLPRARVGPSPAPERSVLQGAAERLMGRSVLILAGDEVARAGAWLEVGDLARVLGARVAVAPDAPRVLRFAQ